MQSNIGKPGLLIRALLGRRLIIKHSCYFSWVASQRTEAMTVCIHGLRGDRSPEIDGLRARARDWQIFSQSPSSILSSIFLYLEASHSTGYFLTCSVSVCLTTGCLRAKCAFHSPTGKSTVPLQRFFTPYYFGNNCAKTDFYEIKLFFLWFTCSWQHFYQCPVLDFCDSEFLIMDLPYLCPPVL